MTTRSLGLLLAASLLLAACSGGGGAAVSSVPPVSQTSCLGRNQLCAEDMLSGVAAQLVSNDVYTPIATAGPALQEFNGVLTTSPAPLQGIDLVEMPGFSVGFITVDDDLVPLDRQIVSSPGLDEAELIFSPGRVWSEPGDMGMSRAAFPFTLTSKFYNGAHNGVATFVYDDTRVSPIYFQMTQETDPPNQIDLWGRMDSQYLPVAYPDIASKRDAWRQELANRIEVRPWSELEAMVGSAALSAFFRDLDPTEISGGGMLVDDVVYALPARTRQGDYPFPLEMRHGVFSVSKSLLGAVALFRLAEKYGDLVLDLFVTDYVDVTASHSGWNGVTFGDLLSMVAGIGDNFPNQSTQATFADENDQSSAKWQAFFAAPDRQGKLDAAFAYDDYPWGPGQVVRYNTTHSFVLAAAVDGFLKATEGPSADLAGMLRAEVFDPLGLRDIPILLTYEDDGSPGLPLFAFGLYLNAYESGRLLQLLQNEGSYEGQQILHRDSLRRALRRVPASDFETSVFVTTSGISLPVRYLHAYYSFDMQTADTCDITVTYLEGFGGNNVVLLPNGIAAFRYADAGLFDAGALALAASAVRPNC